MARPFTDTISSFMEKYPELALQWDHEKNRDLMTDGDHVRVTRKYWWKCEKGHSWNASASSRKKGYGCPYCSGWLTEKGFNDLETFFPDLAREWDHEKNAPLKPDEVTSHSNKKVWWRCSQGHSWKAPVSSRAYGNKCPYCAGRKLLPGFNDLATRNPSLSSEWDYENNKNLTPEMVMAGSDRKVWWKCHLGHRYQANIADRNLTGSGCPYCGNRLVLKGFNDIATTHPSIAETWDYEKNGDLLPGMFTAGVGKIVWWKCEKGHRWKTSINNRCKKLHGCPYCRGSIVMPGFNDLATKNPELAAQWDYEKNGGVTPENVTSGAVKKYWWKCERGHSWKATVNSRNHRKHGCPFCNGKRICTGETDLTTTHPEIMKMWDFEKNTGIDPKGVSIHSLVKVWWKCEKGHQWKSMVRSASNGCPYCNGMHRTSTRFIT